MPINKTMNRSSNRCEEGVEMYNNGELKEKLEIELAS